MQSMSVLPRSEVASLLTGSNKNLIAHFYNMDRKNRLGGSLNERRGNVRDGVVAYTADS